PPLRDDVVWGIASSVGRYPPGEGQMSPQADKADGDEANPGPDDPEPTTPAPGGRRSQATMLLDLAVDVEFFHTADGDAYARIELDGHHEVWPLASKSLRGWLSREFYVQYGRAAGSQAIKDALNVLLGRALYEGSERPVYVRVAGD